MPLILDPDNDDDLILDPDAEASTPSLSVEDHGDGTGATATVSDSHASAFNTVTAYRWLGTGGLLIAAASATRTGNGTVELDLPRGSYWAVVESDIVGVDAAISAPVFFYVTEEFMDENFWLVIQAIATKIQSLSLAGLFTADDVKTRKLPVYDARGEQTRQVIVSPLPESIDTKYNAKSDIAYGVQITMAVPNDGDREAGDTLPQELSVRGIIRRAFEQQPGQAFPLSDVAGAYRIDIVPGAVINPEAHSQNFDVGVLILRVYVRETRGGS